MKIGGNCSSISLSASYHVKKLLNSLWVGGVVWGGCDYCGGEASLKKNGKREMLEHFPPIFHEGQLGL